MTPSTNGLAYADPLYAASLAEFGRVLPLERCRGAVLARPVPGDSGTDLMGCYPLFACRDWAGLARDLESLQGEHVSLTLVTDPFGAPAETDLRDLFDLVHPYKRHFLVDLDLPPETSVSRHHRKSARKALDRLTFDIVEPRRHLDTWQRLYSHIVDKHRVTGIRAFSRGSFEVQAEIPGGVVLTASRGREILGMHWYLTSGDVVYGHLAALHPDAYRVYASHGLFWTAIQHFRGSYRWLDLGAAAGTSPDQTDTLTQFKAAWSSATVPTFLCGKVLAPGRYRSLAGPVDQLGPDAPTYFPSYRRGEFS